MDNQSEIDISSLNLFNQNIMRMLYALLKRAEKQRMCVHMDANPVLRDCTGVHGIRYKEDTGERIFNVHVKHGDTNEYEIHGTLNPGEPLPLLPLPGD